VRHSHLQITMKLCHPTYSRRVTKKWFSRTQTATKLKIKPVSKMMKKHRTSNQIAHKRKHTYLMFMGTRSLQRKIKLSRMRTLRSTLDRCSKTHLKMPWVKKKAKSANLWRSHLKRRQMRKPIRRRNSKSKKFYPNWMRT